VPTSITSRPLRAGRSSICLCISATAGTISSRLHTHVRAHADTLATLHHTAERDMKKDRVTRESSHLCCYTLCVAPTIGTYRQIIIVIANSNDVANLLLRVAVPPRIWIEKAHQERKIILGTFLFEGTADSAPAKSFLKTEKTRVDIADRLVDLCVFYGFDGFLINIETDLGPLREDLVEFLAYMRSRLKVRVGAHAQVNEWHQSMCVHSIEANNGLRCALPVLSGRACLIGQVSPISNLVYARKYDSAVTRS
jgi:hypothetical protein